MDASSLMPTPDTRTRVRVAQVISHVFSPPIVWGALAFPIASRAADTTEKAVIWAAIYVALVCVAPALYIAYMVMSGRITDLHVRVREQRIRPFIVTVLCAAAAWVVLSLMNTSLMPQFALISLIEIAVVLAITLVWQISMHAMSITTAVVVAGALYGFAPALALTPLIPIVGASRVVLRRHTIAQVIAGGALGAAMTLLLMAVLVVQT